MRPDKAKIRNAKSVLFYNGIFLIVGNAILLFLGTGFLISGETFNGIGTLAAGAFGMTFGVLGFLWSFRPRRVGTGGATEP